MDAVIIIIICVRGNWCRRVVQGVGVLCRLRLESARARKRPSTAVTEEPSVQTQHKNRL